MRRTLFAIIALLLVVLLTLTALPLAHGSGNPPPTWGAVLTTVSVPFGQPIGVVVYGPPAGHFGIAVNVQPFNSTSSVLTYSATLPNATNATGYATLNLSIPTTDLDLGPAAVRLFNATSGFSFWQVVHLTPSVNETGVWNAVQNLWQSENVSAVRQIAELQALYNNNVTIWKLYEWTFVYQTAMTGIVLFALRVSSTPQGRKRYADYLRRIWHKMNYRKGYVSPLEDHVGPSQARPRLVSVGAAYHSLICADAECLVRQTERSIIETIKRVHPSIKNPRRGVHYTLDKKAAKAQAERVGGARLTTEGVLSTIGTAHSETFDRFRG